jgi:hypothetical protein
MASRYGNKKFGLSHLEELLKLDGKPFYSYLKCSLVQEIF